MTLGELLLVNYSSWTARVIREQVNLLFRFLWEFSKRNAGLIALVNLLFIHLPLARACSPAHVERWPTFNLNSTRTLKNSSYGQTTFSKPLNACL